MSNLQSQIARSGVLATAIASPLRLILLLCVVILIMTLRSYRRLSHIPGPFFASLTNLSRLLWVKSYRAHEIHINLHRRHGPIVRFGPNMVSVGDPSEIGTIYSFKQPWPKVRRIGVPYPLSLGNCTYCPFLSSLSSGRLAILERLPSMICRQREESNGCWLTCFLSSFSLISTERYC